MTDVNFTPLQEGTPRVSRGGGIRGGSKKTRFYREQLQASPGKWFIWKTGTSHGSDTGQALRTLVGVQSLTGMDRATLAYEATAQKQEDGTYTTYVRYTGSDANVDADDFAPLEERNEQTVVSATVASSPVISNPFGVNA